VSLAARSPASCDARGPIPAIGGVARYYVVRTSRSRGEFSAFKIPDSIDSRIRALHHLDIYGTLTSPTTSREGGSGADVGY